LLKEGWSRRDQGWISIRGLDECEGEVNKSERREGEDAEEEKWYKRGVCSQEASKESGV